MPRSARDTRQQILQQAHRLFRKSGFFRAGIDEIAAASRVTKRTLYHHFESKDALLAAVMAARHEEVFATPHPYGIELGGTPEEIVDQLFGELVKWSSTPHWAGSGFTRVVMELADMPGHPARTIAHEHKAALERYLAVVLAEAGVEAPHERTRELFMLIEGTMALILIHGDPTCAMAAAAAAKRLLSPARPSRARPKQVASASA